ncbi:putative bifunctional diguanylate cyclase/phosphodiesterase [Meiothermus granaticius]|uniref:Phytochrome-like protein cph2 n=1 Tax=Meiothermus granaticius NBRC 107808 TaxID=1227551 RepID=A0A399F3S9_9DEIN|nr:EAL domain-containing protein [Meiothermus granaticius]RIH90753.1 Phytochrome-like protein cph2 [Meiothermus granaticius NBRC 107808]GEM86932.1 hypothetical protein MGR01S_15570 [Meiothermus granaticius NBRC 107808]
MGDPTPLPDLSPLKPIPWSVALLSLASYVGFYLLAYPHIGGAASPVVALWVGLLGWGYGPRVGVWAGLLSIPLHGLLFWGLKLPLELAFLRPAPYLWVALGFAAGWLRQTLERLRGSEERYGQLVRQAPVGILVHDGEVVHYANARALQILGAKSGEVLGKPLRALLTPESQQIWETLGEGAPRPARGDQTAPLELKLLRPDAQTVAVEWSAVPLHLGGRKAFQVVLHDLTRTQELQATLEHLTYRDPVTDLPNRAALREFASGLLTKGHTVGVLWLEPQDFRDYISALGHEGADHLLQVLAQRLAASVPPGGLLAHLGGGSFVLLAPYPEVEGPQSLANPLLEGLQSPVLLGGQPIHLRAAVGIATYPQDGLVLDQLLSAAAAAYAQARLERHWVAHYDPRRSQDVREQMSLESDLHEALERGELSLYFQPVLDLCREQIVGVEALARWFHPTRGAVSPGVFIPLAEERGLIRALDRMVLEEALRTAVTLPGWVAVNLSAQSFLDPGLPKFVWDCLDRFGVEPWRLVLEITERVLALPAKAQPVLKELQALGVQVAVDDFGTGYSSLSYLREFNLNYLKVDQAFTGRIGASQKDEAVLEGILILAAGLGLRVIAEGVEKPIQLRWLKEAGGELAQGYHIARPMGTEALHQLLENWQPSSR